MSGLENGKKRPFVSLPSQDDLTMVEPPNVNDLSSASKVDDQNGSGADTPSTSKPGPASLDLNPSGEDGRLRRGLSARQVQMIAIAGM